MVSAVVGALVGDVVGMLVVGVDVGVLVGADVGMLVVGAVVGVLEGVEVGLVGVLVGALVGEVGSLVGALVGAALVGALVGAAVGGVGAIVGSCVGAWVGAPVGEVGSLVGVMVRRANRMWECLSSAQHVGERVGSWGAAARLQQLAAQHVGVCVSKTVGQCAASSGRKAMGGGRRTTQAYTLGRGRRAGVIAGGMDRELSGSPQNRLSVSSP